jgi:hypothetical protein
MALVFRNGRPRLQRSIRRGGRGTTEYRASGEAALLIARMEVIGRDKWDFEQWREREERKRFDALERALDDLAEQARTLARDALERGPAIASITGANGDGAVSQELVKVILNERIMDEWAANQLVEWAAGPKGKEKTKENLRRELNEVATDLAGPSPSPAERMLAEVAALNWFALRLHEAWHASASNAERGLTIT